MAMGYEEIWQKIKSMSQQSRKMLAYEMTLKGINVGYIHPHYYFDAKNVHDILFYPKHSQHEIDDMDDIYYQALKGIMENDKEIHMLFKRYVWLPRIINDRREGRLVNAYICSRLNDAYVNARYRILPGKSLSGERPRSLFITLTSGSEVVYKMTECSVKNCSEFLTFSRTEY